MLVSPFFHRQPPFASVSLHNGAAVGLFVVINHIVTTLHNVTVLAEQMPVLRFQPHLRRVPVVRYAEFRLLWKSEMEPHTFLAPYLAHGCGCFLDSLLEATGTKPVFVRLSWHERTWDAFTSFPPFFCQLLHAPSGFFIDPVSLAGFVSVHCGVPLRLLLLPFALLQSVLACQPVESRFADAELRHDVIVLRVLVVLHDPGNLLFSERLAATIADALKAKGISQKQFAAMTGRSESEISEWLSGDRNFTIDTLITIEQALGSPILKVVGKEEPMPA